MKNRWYLVFAAGVIAVCGACRKTTEAEAAQTKAAAAERAKKVAQRLASVDANSDDEKPVAQWVLPMELREISGLALLPSGQLLAHGDEQGIVVVIDPRSGLVGSRFQLRGGVHGDFEGITVVGNDIYMMQSNGRIFQFRQGANKAHVPYVVHDTKLGKECEFEGIAYEADSSRFVMACKRVTKKGIKDRLILYRVALRNGLIGDTSSLSLPLEDVIGANNWKHFHPSDITVDPTTGNYVIIAAQEKAIVVMTPAGEIVRATSLPGKHPQAEGVAITPDNVLIVSDEATTTPAVITLYRWRP
jgi:uncharacterized protein YjiK